MPWGPAWTESETAALVRWRHDGYTATQIVTLFFETFRRHISRNAILGRLHRIAGPLYKNPTPNRKPRPPRRKPSAPVVRRKPARPPPPEGVALLDLTADACRWPIDPNNNHKYCGAGTVDGHPYCEAHCKRAYVNTTTNKPGGVSRRWR